MASKSSKSKKKRSGIGQRLATMLSVIVTALTGAGFGGWAFPDMPIVGKLVQQLVGSTPTGEPDWPTPEELHEAAHEIRDVVGTEAQRVAAAYAAQHPDSIPAAAAAALSAHTPNSQTTVVSRPVSSATAAPLAQGATISICSYNIQVFGESKLGKPQVMNCLVQVVRRFDLVAIQEIRSTSDSIIPEFVQQINADGSHYSYVVGPRLGRTNSKEQYAFVFRTDHIEMDPRSVLTIADPADKLHREPLIARFRARTSDPARGFTFWLMDAHTDPDEVPTEVDALADAFASVQQQGWGEDDVILVGDLNASETQFGRLGALPGIRWAIAGVPTNTRGTKTYDNILFDGRTTVEFTGQSGVGNVRAVLGLTEEQALEVSDHFPVWATFSAYEGGNQPQYAQQPQGAVVR